MHSNPPQLIRLRARPGTLYLSRGRTVLATATDGFIYDGSAQGLFVHETRVLSRHSVRVNGQSPQPNALSNIEQHSWLGYYLLPAPGAVGERDHGSGQVDQASQQSLEIRISRVGGEGIHEDLDITNFSQHATQFTLDVELAADFADLIETTGERLQHGQLQRMWRDSPHGAAELEFTYRVHRHYEQQNERGEVRLERGVIIRIENASSPPEPTDSGVRFAIELNPLTEWHVCIRMLPRIEDALLEPPRGCRALAEAPPFQAKSLFLAEATKFEAAGSETLTATVVGALRQAVYDLEALRLPDLDHGRRAWTVAAGLPMYVALFGRDTLTTAWQAALAGPEMMRGTLAELERWQPIGCRS